MNRKFVGALLVIIISFVMFSSVYAGISTSFPNSDGYIVNNVDKSVKTVWGTVVVIVQMLAIGAVIFAGLRYMYASADRRADIKKSLIILAIGSILVFATTTVVEFIVNVANETL